MVVQHNIPAFNANRQLGINNNALSKSLEKLSSGYAINRAGDNAAGLAISEKMRGQISGLTQASANAQDAISLIQTGEGALQETHSILQRMRELSVQSANGTYQDEVDRENIAKEVDALKSELDRISSSTEFNGMKLLDGSISGVETDGRTIGKIDGVTTGSIDKTYGNISKINVSGSKSSVRTATIAGSGNTAGEVVVSNKAQNKVAIAATTAGFSATTSTGAGPAGTGVSITLDFRGATMATAAGPSASGAAVTADPAQAAADYIKNMDNVMIKLDNLNIRFTSQKTGDESSYDEASQTLTIGIRDLAASDSADVEKSMDEALVKLISEKATDSDTLTNSGYGFTTDGQKLQITIKGNTENNVVATGVHVSTYKLEKETGTIDLSNVVAGDVKSGTTFTVDGKTYELTNDASSVKNGNIAVTVGDRTDASATAAHTIENASDQELAKALFNAIMAQGDYSDSNNNKSGLVIELDVTGGNAKITVTNEGERVENASKVTGNGSREEVTNTLKIDQVVQKGTTIQVGDTTVTFDEDTTAADALKKIEKEVVDGLVAKYGASGAGQVFDGAKGSDATASVTVDYNAKTITFNAMFGERQDVSVTPVENAERQTVTLNPDKIENGSTLSYGGKTYEFVGKEGDKVTTKGNIAVVNNANVAENTYKAILASSKTSGDTTDIKLKGDTLEFATSAKITTSTAIDESKASKNEKLTFQIGANGTEDQRVSLGIDSMSSSTIGITTKDEETGKVTVEKSIADIDVSTREAANDAIAVIDAAINQVSGTRADLGALQNRLEHTISSLDIANENLTAAESRIRDTDMASEMMKFTKNQIMSQASQSMLAQANTLPQGVLSLLQ